MGTPGRPIAASAVRSARSLGLPRVPPEYDGLQVNFCKDPTCPNFGVPLAPTRRAAAAISNAAKAAAATAEPGTRTATPGHYTVKGRGIDPMAVCGICGASFPFKSNQGIVEERDRLKRYLAQHPPATCRTAGCANSAPIGTGDAWAVHGKTKSGNPRWRCSVCGKTASRNVHATRRQTSADKNRLIFMMLVGKSPFIRIADVAEVHQPTVHHRFAFIHHQCVAFVAERERQLATKRFERLYLGVDRQDITVNWRKRANRRNVILSSVGTVDNSTGYCFALSLNFDPSVDPAVAKKSADESGDPIRPGAWRRHARIWLADDYRDAAIKRAGRRAATPSIPVTTRDGVLDARIEDTYNEALIRDDIESPEVPDTDDKQLPEMGAQTRLEYTLYGHFQFLKTMMANVGKWRFFLDQDSGMRAACLGTFHREIKERTCDAWYIRIDKTATIDLKRRSVQAARAAFDAEKAARPGLTDNDIVCEMFKRQLAAMTPHGTWRDRWLSHPLPTMSEPEKASCLLTDFGDFTPDHSARLHALATLHAVDSLFNRIRRRASMLERPIASANTGRVWSGYAFYRPERVAWMLEILRVCHNYVFIGRDGRTPAMRIGLAASPIDYREIIDFVSEA